MAYRLLFLTGGSGGHVYPALAVARRLKHWADQNKVSVELKFAGDGQLLDEIVNELDASLIKINGFKWRSYVSLWTNVKSILSTPWSVIKSAWSVWSYMPDLVFSKGSAASVAPLFASLIMFVPIVIHESDVVPGKVARIFGRFAKKIFVSYEKTVTFFDKTKTLVSGVPIRSELLEPFGRQEALNTFKLLGNRPIILVAGGSQGSKIINDTFLDSAAELIDSFDVIHQCGVANYEELRERLQQLSKEGKESYGPKIAVGYRLYANLNARQMSAAYSVCDVIVGRSGSQIFEFAYAGKPSIVIPLKIAAYNHQVENATEFAKFGATVISESNLKSHILISELGKAYQKRGELGPRIKQFAKPEAADIIAQSLLTMV